MFSWVKGVIYVAISRINDKKRLHKYKKGKYKIASTGDAMKTYINWIKARTDIKINNIMEIGANYAQDAEVLKIGFGVSDRDVYVFEAHPDIFKAIKELHNFNAYNFAVSDYDGYANFNICSVDADNTGISSLRKNKSWDTKEVKTQVIRMDSFLDNEGILGVDFLKIDVEGCSWEVLNGFGNKLKSVKVIQVEAEHIEKWQGEKLWDDIYEKLRSEGFELAIFERTFTQSDSLWIRKAYLKTD